MSDFARLYQECEMAGCSAQVPRAKAICDKCSFRGADE